MPGWIDAQTLGDFVKDNLSRAPGNELRQHWDSIISAAIDFGYGEIVSAFGQRGYTPAQVAAWDRGLEFHRDIAAWYALQRMKVLSPDSYNGDTLKTLDRRLDLRGDKSKDWPAVVLTIGGVPQNPGGTWGQPSTGPLDTSQDMFVPDTDDSRIGTPTRL